MAESARAAAEARRRGGFDRREGRRTAVGDDAGVECGCTRAWGRARARREESVGG